MTQEIINLEKQYVLHTYNRPPFILERGDGTWIYDTDGNRYLDAGSGIAVSALGHQHEAIVRAIKEAADGLLHVSNLYHTAPHAKLAQILCESSFADKAFFCNSGTEANEGAIKFARKWAKVNDDEQKTGLVAFSGSFHGRTMGALSLTSREKYRAPFEPLIGGTQFATFNDLASAEATINDQTCAVIVEPIQGEGGVTPAKPEFLAGLRQLCDQHNALLIFDEVQCGLGRTGQLWGHQSYGITPDIMTLAKPLGGGLPIGAILVNERVAQVMQPGDHASTFAGGPFVCHVANAVLDQITQPAFMARVQSNSLYLQETLKRVISKTSLLTDMRGKGMMWGLISTIPAVDIMTEAYQHGLLILVAGDNIVRLLPPLTISREEIDTLGQRLLKTLEAVG
ncbi:aspartate aminotransferase family protein [Anaerolineales bacterium HSG6]|nr:aspartate aminotransferase family protein [Anaerolineales bacterium HSG6]